MRETLALFSCVVLPLSCLCPARKSLKRLACVVISRTNRTSESRLLYDKNSVFGQQFSSPFCLFSCFSTSCSRTRAGQRQDKGRTRQDKQDKGFARLSFARILTAAP